MGGTDKFARRLAWCSPAIAKERMAALLTLKRLSPVIGDLLLVPLALLLAFQLRFGLQPMPAPFVWSALALSPLVMLAVAPCWWAGTAFGKRLPQVWRLALVALCGAVLGIVLILLLNGLDLVPRSSLLVLAPVLWLLWLARRAVAWLLQTCLPALGLPLHGLGSGSVHAASAVWRWRRHALDLLLVAAFCGVLYWAFHDRAAWVNATFGEYLGCDSCLTGTLFLHDYLFFGVLLLLFLLSFMARAYLLYIPLRLLALAGILLYIGDIVLMDEFYTRLMLSDIRIYGEQWPIVWRHITSTAMFAGHSWLVALPLVAGLMLLLVPPVIRASRKTVVALCVLPLLGSVSGAVMTPPSYVQDWALRNVFAANFNNGVSVPYSDTYRTQVLDAAGARPPQCIIGENQRPDIVLLILESWSPFQSALWSGMENWTPRLDALATEHAWFSRMHASGFTTNEGLMSILTGVEFLAPTKSYFSIMPFETAWETPASVPRELASNGGYHSAFLTSGNVGFTSKGKWLTSLGFDYVEGHDYPGYEGLDRLHFDAPADEFLYARSLDYVREQTEAAAPLFLTVESVSTHHPYIHPLSGERSAEAVFRYMDETVDDFYRQLQEMDFFDNGLLVIVGDHRAMIPIRSAEEERFAQAAASLVPMIVVGGKTQGKIATPFHQSDILPSLGALTGEQYCQSESYQSFLTPAAQDGARCLYHARGDNRDHIDAFCPLPDGTEARAAVLLHGDDTRILDSTAMSRELKRQVLNEINTHRVLGDERTAGLIKSGYFD